MFWHICNKSVTFLMSLTFELLRNIENYRIFSKETIHIDVVYCNRIRFGRTKWNWFADFFLSSQNSNQRRRYNQTNTKIVADITNNTQQTKKNVFFPRSTGSYFWCDTKFVQKWFERARLNKRRLQVARMPIKMFTHTNQMEDDRMTVFEFCKSFIGSHIHLIVYKTVFGVYIRRMHTNKHMYEDKTNCAVSTAYRNHVYIWNRAEYETLFTFHPYIDKSIRYWHFDVAIA